jgi:hypothetical protein
MTYSEIWQIFITGIFPILTPLIITCAGFSILCSVFSNHSLRVTFPIVAAFGLLGGITGYSVGASRVPVLGLVLPAMLTLCSAVLGYLFSKEQLKTWRLVIPFCIIVLSINSYIGLFIGSEMRGKFEEYDKKYAEWLLYYEKVELEKEKKEALKD